MTDSTPRTRKTVAQRVAENVASLERQVLRARKRRDDAETVYVRESGIVDDLRERLEHARTHPALKPVTGEPAGEPAEEG